jgi:hypothetical protein
MKREQTSYLRNKVARQTKLGEPLMAQWRESKVVDTVPIKEKIYGKPQP